MAGKGWLLMRTAASILGLKEDLAMEKALAEFRSQVGYLEQKKFQSKLTSVDRLHLEYMATMAIVQAFQLECLGMTEQDITSRLRLVRELDQDRHTPDT